MGRGEVRSQMSEDRCQGKEGGKQRTWRRKEAGKRSPASRLLQKKK
jgi:hypothetical protein